MAESICRVLRDGSLEGEHVVALTIKDSLHCSFGSHAFDHFLCSLASNVSAGKSQARGIVLVAYERSPSFYLNLLKSKGLSVALLDSWFCIIDCFSDPLGWKEKLRNLNKGLEEAFVEGNVTVFRNVRDIDNLLLLILELGRGVVGDEKARFSIAIDSVSSLLRHVSLSSVANLITSIRSNDKISCVFWLMHTDLHELRQSNALEYVSTVVVSIEPNIKPSDEESYNIWQEKNLLGGKLLVRLKRRNGKVKIMNEEFYIDLDGIKFTAAIIENASAIQNLLPKVQFNLQLSEKELADRAKVVLPFEHQGNGETIQIYDGRQSLSNNKKGPYSFKQASSAHLETKSDQGGGEIHYIRDSDDELLDSDEDPDDDLDI